MQGSSLTHLHKDQASIGLGCFECESEHAASCSKLNVYGLARVGSRLGIGPRCSEQAPVTESSYDGRLKHTIGRLN